MTSEIGKGVVGGGSSWGVGVWAGSMGEGSRLGPTKVPN
jgi:hypothetical protein